MNSSDSQVFRTRGERILLPSVHHKLAVVDPLSGMSFRELLNPMPVPGPGEKETYQTSNGPSQFGDGVGSSEERHPHEGRQHWLERPRLPFEQHLPDHLNHQEPYRSVPVHHQQAYARSSAPASNQAQYQHQGQPNWPPEHSNNYYAPHPGPQQHYSESRHSVHEHYPQPRYHEAGDPSSFATSSHNSAPLSPQHGQPSKSYSSEAQSPRQTQKRPVVEDTGRVGPPKRPRTNRAKADPSKKAPTARKRSESVQTGSVDSPLHEGLAATELQNARCMAPKYKDDIIPRCISCTRRWAGDSCRFSNIRFIVRNSYGEAVGVSFVDINKPDATLDYPLEWNVTLTLDHIKCTRFVIAEALLPVLREELRHLDIPNIIRRPRESDVRVTCDGCMTSIFSCSWMCRNCGREFCVECTERTKGLTYLESGVTEAEAADHRKKLAEHQYKNPGFLACGGAKGQQSHTYSLFSPMSRFSRHELQDAITEMEKLLEDRDAAAAPLIMAPSPASTLTPMSSRPASSSGHQTAPEIASALGAEIPHLPLDRSGIPFHDTETYTHEHFTEEVFRELWRAQVPIVVTGLSPKFAIQWNPEYFQEKYKDQSVRVLECQSNEKMKGMSVGFFFSQFGQYADRENCWKLKDWPPSSDFKTTFPELYQDFSSVVPVPNYVRRDGVWNLASHFPSNAVAPDIGPKMYNAMATYLDNDSHGSTRLHMDMADACNIMTFAADCPDGSPGCAAWDLYRAADSEKLRDFMRKEFNITNQDDPIHIQRHYLDTNRRKKLYDDYGVKSHRIYQMPGEAVFIPAGCAHQVCNLADCIKVAIDFVSPENISRCENLTKEFREQNKGRVWKEDVLQLKTMMWFAWLSCSAQLVAKTG